MVLRIKPPLWMDTLSVWINGAPDITRPQSLSVVGRLQFATESGLILFIQVSLTLFVNLIGAVWGRRDFVTCALGMVRHAWLHLSGSVMI